MERYSISRVPVVNAKGEPVDVMYIEDVLSEKILYGQLKPGEFVLVGTSGEGAEETFTFEGSVRSVTLPEIPDTPPVDSVADQVTDLAAD